MRLLLVCNSTVIARMQQYGHCLYATVWLLLVCNSMVIACMQQYGYCLYATVWLLLVYNSMVIACMQQYGYCLYAAVWFCDVLSKGYWKEMKVIHSFVLSICELIRVFVGLLFVCGEDDDYRRAVDVWL